MGTLKANYSLLEDFNAVKIFTFLDRKTMYLHFKLFINERRLSMIKNFSCHNFRNIDVENIDLNKINILIGPNNSGKTNFIKALTFYSNILKHSDEGSEETDFLNAIARNGWSHSKNYLAEKKDAVSFEWRFDLMDKPFVYRFAYNIGNEREDYKICLEHLAFEINNTNQVNELDLFRIHKPKSGRGVFTTNLQTGVGLKNISVNVDGSKTIINQFDNLLLQNENLYNSRAIRHDLNAVIKGIEKFFKSFFCYSSAEFKTEEIRRRVNAMSFDAVLKRDGINLANVFANYKNKSLFWKQEYVNVIQRVIRTLKDIDISVQRDSMTLHLIEGNKEVELSDVSEGTIKALIWGLLFCVPSGKGYELLAIDEPEANMHPAWQNVIADIILESKSYDQCVISTHSPEFLDKFTEAFKRSESVAVLVFDLDGHVRRIKYDEIAEDMGDWLLGDLYRTQDPALGGWPW